MTESQRNCTWSSMVVSQQLDSGVFMKSEGTISIAYISNFEAAWTTKSNGKRHCS